MDFKGRRKARRVGVGKEGRRRARAAAEQIQARLALGDLTSLEDAPPQTSLTFQDYAIRWLAETITPHRKPRTEEFYRAVPPKSGKSRRVDLAPSLRARLADMKSLREAEAAVAGDPPSPWVFPAPSDPSKPLNASWFRRHVWYPLLDKAGLRHVRVHDARHICASLLLQRGEPVGYVTRSNSAAPRFRSPWISTDATIRNPRATGFKGSQRDSKASH